MQTPEIQELRITRVSPSKPATHEIHIDEILGQTNEEVKTLAIDQMPTLELPGV